MIRILFAATLCAGATWAPAAPKFDKLASMPGKAPEGVGYGADGLIYFTSAGSMELLRYRAGKVETFATLPINALVVVAGPNGFVVDGHAPVDRSGGGSIFTKLDGAGRVVAVDRNGKVTKELKVGSLPNGLVHLRDELYLAADSVEGKVWRIDMAKGEASTWIEDPRLKIVAGGPGPGANGLKLHGGYLYIAHTSGGFMYRVAVGKDGKAAGALAQFAVAPAADDFDIARDGTLYIATHGPIIKVTPQGVASNFTDPKLIDGGPTLMLSKDQKSLYVFTSGPELPAAPNAAPSPTGQPQRGAPELLQLWLP